jgi:hypothetical protein
VEITEAHGDVLDIITSTFADGARLQVLTDNHADYKATGGPGLYNKATGYYPTVDMLGARPSEDMFLDLQLNDGIMTLSYDKKYGFLSATFDSNDVVIIGGDGASQFQNAVLDFAGLIKGPGYTASKTKTANWMYNDNTNVLMNTAIATVPAPGALISLFSGLTLMGGYRLRRKS